MKRRKISEIFEDMNKLHNTELTEEQIKLLKEVLENENDEVVEND